MILLIVRSLSLDSGKHPYPTGTKFTMDQIGSLNSSVNDSKMNFNNSDSLSEFAY